MLRERQHRYRVNRNESAGYKQIDSGNVIYLVPDFRIAEGLRCSKTIKLIPRDSILNERNTQADKQKSYQCEEQRCERHRSHTAIQSASSATIQIRI